MQVLKEVSRSDSSTSEVAVVVLGLLQDVKDRGDAALLELTERFEGVELESVGVPRASLKQVYGKVDRLTQAVW